MNTERNLNIIKRNFIISIVLLFLTILGSIIVCIIFKDLTLTNPKFFLSLSGIFVVLGIPAALYATRGILEFSKVWEDEFEEEFF